MTDTQVKQLEQQVSELANKKSRLEGQLSLHCTTLKETYGVANAREAKALLAKLEKDEQEARAMVARLEEEFCNAYPELIATLS